MKRAFSLDALNRRAPGVSSARMLSRVLEPEVMDTEEEASDYDSMDHSVVNAAFCADFLATSPDVDSVLDLGTGTARIPIELCRRSSGAKVVAADLADRMLDVARKNVATAGLADRVTLQKIDAKRTHFSDASFSSVVCNSIIHHIPEPTTALAEMWRVLRPGGTLFVRDLVRPDSDAAVNELVVRYEGAPTDGSERARQSFERQRALLDASFRASLTVDEVAAIARACGMPDGAVRMTSDRHWTLTCKKPR
jgi:ubiquinone/menaquinone biosynthesis C-methylase UbiE